MSQRTFKYFTIVSGGTPQPLVGTTLSAALTAPLNPDTAVNAAVADSSMFLNGDWVVLEVDGAALEERVKVFNVPDSTHIKLVGVKNSHASGAIVRLGTAINSLFVQSKDGNAAPLFIGTSSAMVKAIGAFVIAKIVQVAAGTQPTELDSTRSGLANPDTMGQLWIDGTTSDSYLVSVGQL